MNESKQIERKELALHKRKLIHQITHIYIVLLLFSRRNLDISSIKNNVFDL